MTISPAEQVFEEILPYLEILDAQIGGAIQLLKDKGITTTEEFAKYVERTDRGSNVTEVGFRVRMEYLFSSAASEARPRNLVVPSKLGLLANHSLPIDKALQNPSPSYEGGSYEVLLAPVSLNFAANICAPASSSWFHVRAEICGKQEKSRGNPLPAG